MRERGSILVGVLWCLALLSVVVVGVLHTARMDLLVVKNYGDRLQAHYNALAGVERAKALIYHDYVTRRQSGINHNGTLYDDSKDFENVSFGRGSFRVIRRGSEDEGGGLIYGISDEERRLNINTAFAGELTNIAGMTPEIVASILAWRSDVGQGDYMGAGADYYASLEPPYVPRNGPFQTVRELLMVRGVTREDLLGDDSVNQNDLLDTGDGEASSSLEGGWAAILTANSTENNSDAAGNPRVNIQTADESALQQIDGISSDIAHSIVTYRAQKQFQSIGNLLDVTNASGGGQNPIDDDLFMRIADKVTISDDQNMAGMININTASEEVLRCLPVMGQDVARAIIAYRQSNGYFANIGELLRVPGMDHNLFKNIAQLITARSETFRITGEGRIASTGARQRVQAIIHVGSHEITTLAYREDL